MISLPYASKILNKMLQMHLSSSSKIEVGTFKPNLTLYGLQFAVANSYVLHTPTTLPMLDVF